MGNTWGCSYLSVCVPLQWPLRCPGHRGTWPFSDKPSFWPCADFPGFASGHQKKPWVQGHFWRGHSCCDDGSWLCFTTGSPRLIQVREDLWRSLVQPLLTHDFLQLSFKYLEGWRAHEPCSSAWSLLLFLITDQNFTCSKLHSLPLVISKWTLRKSLGSIPLHSQANGWRQ